MLKVSISILLTVTFTMLAGCSTFTKPGMTFSEVKESVTGTCSGLLGPQNTLFFHSTHETLSDVRIYGVKYQTNFDEDCRKLYYFKNDILLSDNELKKLLQERREQEAFNARQEQLRLERTRQEERNRINALVEVSNSYMSKNNAKIIYRDGTFVIGQKLDGTMLYHKDGSTKNPSEVQQEIDGYKRFLVYQKEMEIIRKKNLSRNWHVNAVGNRGCSVEKITESYRSDDGSAIFNINYSCRHSRSSGSSGQTTIACGYNQSNKKDSTSVTAWCN